ncbi:MAG: hypothetical protein QOJ03_3354, partial [Frankiaceae bacterium]|nr:hypothetical protein [Frankiaceae bacterium]
MKTPHRPVAIVAGLILAMGLGTGAALAASGSPGAPTKPA